MEPSTTAAAEPPPSPSSRTAAAASAAASEIARAVQRRFATLPGNGKPAGHEHTVLAGFVVVTNSDSSPDHPPDYTVASLATGTKCLGATRRREAAERCASLLHDSHAEALARRGLLLWVHDQLRLALVLAAQSEGGGGGHGAEAAAGPTTATTTPTPPPTSCFFRWLPARRRFVLLPGVQLYLYVSQPPCGDASILHDSDAEDNGDDGDEGALPKAAAALPPNNPSSGRTGAKLIEPATAAVVADDSGTPAASITATPQVPQAGHVEAVARAQRKGALRRKPGKGDATLSMSCSDKLARWQVLGLQGALLSSVLDAPLRLSGVVVSVPPTTEAGQGQGAAEDVELAVRRAVFDRFQVAIEDAADVLRSRDDDAEAAAGERLLRSALHRLLLRAATAMAAPPPPASLGLSPSETRRVPCGVAINWHNSSGGNNNNKAEVTVGATGCRAGVSGRAARDAAATRSRLSRASLATKFAELLEVIEEEAGGAPSSLSAAEARVLPLSELKRRAAPAYTRAWAALLDSSSSRQYHQQHQQLLPAAFAGAWLRKPEDGLAVADYPAAPAAIAGRADAAATGAGRGGRAGDGGDEEEPSKRARTSDVAPHTRTADR